MTFEQIIQRPSDTVQEVRCLIRLAVGIGVFYVAPRQGGSGISHWEVELDMVPSFDALESVQRYSLAQAFVMQKVT